jgi:energy-coupling factor transporter ATP-binding protein EcfA2
MIIRHIKVENWRSLVNPVEIAFNENINILHGSNGQGKSTLVEAMRMAFLDRFSLTGSDVGKIQPWGRELSPKVEIEFSDQGSTYRLCKKFLADKSCTVARLEAGTWMKYREGEAADEWARSLFHAQAPGKGVSKADHWGLARILWIPQGMPAYGGMTDALRTLLIPTAGAGGVENAPAGALEAAIRKKYGEYYTDKGAVRSGAGSLAEQEKCLQEAKARVDAIRVQLDEIDLWEKVVQENTRAVWEYHRQIEAETATMQALEQEVERFRTDALAAEQGRTRAEKSERERDNLKNRLARLDDAIAGQSRERALGDALTKETAALAKKLQDAGDVAAAAQRQAGRLDHDAETVTAVKAMAAEARTYRDRTAELAMLAEKKKTCDRLAEEIRINSAKIGDLRAPDKKEITALRRHLEDQKDARRELSALQLTLQFTASRAIRWKTLNGEPAVERDMDERETLAIRGLGIIEAEIEGAGVIRVQGPVGESADSLATKIARASEKIAAAVERFGTDNPEILQDRLGQAQLLEKESESKRNERDKTLGSLDDEGLLTAIARAGAMIRDYETRYPTWRDQVPDAGLLQKRAEELDADYAQRKVFVVREMERTRVEQMQISERLHDAQTRHASTQTALERYALLCEQLRDGHTDETLQTALDKLNGEAVIALREKTALEERVKAYAADPVAAHAALRLKAEGLQSLLVEKEKQTARAITEISVRGGRGLYSQLAENEEKLYADEHVYAAARLRAEALKLLYDTLCAVHAEQREKVVSPITMRASRLFQQINDRRMGMISLSENMDIAGFMPVETSGRMVGIDANLSGGEKEQLYLATRLALAEYLIPAGSGKHPVVLDDFLTATDDVRMSRIKELVETMTERFQFLILTCHPERYMGMRGVTMAEI